MTQRQSSSHLFERFLASVFELAKLPNWQCQYNDSFETENPTENQEVSFQQKHLSQKTENWKNWNFFSIALHKNGFWDF